MNEQLVAMMFSVSQSVSAVVLIGGAWLAGALAVGIGLGRGIAQADRRPERDLARRAQSRRP